MIKKIGTYQHELIGKQLKGVYNKKLISGKVIDETKNTIIIEGKKLLKNNLTIQQLDNKNVEIHGNKINVRPADRIKLK